MKTLLKILGFCVFGLVLFVGGCLLRAILTEMLGHGSGASHGGGH